MAVETLKASLRTYLETCRSIFANHRSRLSNVIQLPGSSGRPQETAAFLSKAIEEAESRADFESFFKSLDSEVLARDLARLTKQEENRRSRQKKSGGHRGKGGRALRDWRLRIARQAAHRFFTNSGLYMQVWLNSKVDESKLFEILAMPAETRSSEYLRLFVFDGFSLYGAGRRITDISLPAGDLKVYAAQKLRAILRFPQLAWHDTVPQHLPDELMRHHILVAKEGEPYRGAVGLWINDRLVPGISLVDIGDITREKSDIDIFGPLFLCLGDCANLAEEIRIRTNIFDSTPVVRKIRNDYLPWDQFDDEGSPCPRSTLKDIGDEGTKLKNVYEAWIAVNSLSKDGFLRLPTEVFTRAIMNLHNSRYGKSTLREVFVSLVTAVEAVLAGGSRSELAYKTAMRGCALLTYHGEERWKAFRIINKFYDIRSKIVHEGDAGDVGLDELIYIGLLEMCRQILLRYVFLIYSGLSGEFPNWVLPKSDWLRSNGQRAKAVSRILDAAIMHPKLIAKLESSLERRGLRETQQWKHPHVLSMLLPEG